MFVRLGGCAEVNQVERESVHFCVGSMRAKLVIHHMTAFTVPHKSGTVVLLRCLPILDPLAQIFPPTAHERLLCSCFSRDSSSIFKQANAYQPNANASRTPNASWLSIYQTAILLETPRQSKRVRQAPFWVDSSVERVACLWHKLYERSGTVT